jgi:hypothetical protein
MHGGNVKGSFQAKARMFFFEKKNQKTLYPFRSGRLKQPSLKG